MIWKMHKNRKIRSLCLGLFLFACCLFFGCSSSLKASAAVVNVTNANFNRSYFHSGIGSPTTNENVGSQNIPYTTLTYSQGVYKLLYTLIGSTTVSDGDFSHKYKTILFNLIFKQQAYNSNDNPLAYYDNAIFQVTSHKYGQSSEVNNIVCDAPQRSQTGSTNITYYMSVSCSWQFSDYRSIDAFSITLGSTNYSDIQQYPFNYDWAYVGNYDLIAPGSTGWNGDLVLDSFAYELKSTDDPLIAGQDRIIDINSNILDTFQSIQQQEAEERNQLNAQKDQNNIDATNAGNAATQANTPLFSAITTIYGYLLYPTPSNCVIGPVSVYDLNLGNLDFCTGFDIPQPLIAIGGLAMIGLVLALCFAVLHSAISLYREFLGGGK